ncbi:exodeoxyribonuclease V subunit beta [Lysobacter sp. TY2-98]|uniref:UvrD-helicase domain-containing protein n=1 Tax=Lysobacter sp. TY2-98 TaxID=2290922 RepID=UPI000E204401|nr:UvrD-helicase domain-containing protein [Lysobacter sp. TY2-98]AXK73275.1 exodeoxyribonuclease V subunit beta [Lysobacter sp. TY2-98]
MSIVDLPPPDLAAHDEVDPFLDMPLTGIRLIEASAGTGKTFTLATIVTRLVVERGLRVGQILAVTFTEAATQELRERLRRRLQLLARVASGAAVEGDESEVALCRELVERQQRVEDPVALRRRLQQAAAEIDAAAVHTIHGFCTRVLADHALETGASFHDAGTPGDDRALLEIVAHDLWRTLAADAGDAELLATWWSSPEALAADLGELLRATALRPDAPTSTESPMPALHVAAAALRDAWRTHGVELRGAIEAALAGKVLSATSYKVPTLTALYDALDGWRDEDIAAPAKLELLSTVKLAACTNKGKDAQRPQSPLCTAVDTYLARRADYDTWLDARRLALLHRVRTLAGKQLAQVKRQQHLRSFDDLIDDVARALDGPHGRALTAQLRRQYRAALVDEFQDTDARQWSIFRRVFADDAANAPLLLDDDVHVAPFLALIGDPKQAIYGFRGGDVHTYLRARDVAQPAPSLLRNFRSRPGVLRAIERLYANGGETAFVDARIRFQSVDAGGRRGDDACLRDGAPMPALTIRRLPATVDGKPLDADASRRDATRACAAAIRDALASGADGTFTVDGRAVEPGDIAVLVRKHDEALRMQRALSALGIPAVTAGRASLFATPQAMELLAIFDALLAPADVPRLNAALATVLIGFDAARIDALMRDDVARARQLAHALAWRERWLRAGPLALVNELCSANAPRLLELIDGERRLSDFMQLGEALQDAGQRALGPQGLVDWLRARIASADDRDPEQQLRLESDARRVQILTVHKSKGLEFPLVYLPFAAIGSAAKSPRWCNVHDGDTRVLDLQPDDACKRQWRDDEAAEDARLLYVALTRAEHALWLCTGPLYAQASTPLAKLLGDIDALADGDVVIEDGPVDGVERMLMAGDRTAQPPRARTARRTLARDWAVYSFSALARLGSGSVETLLPRDERAAAPDEPLPAAAPLDVAAELVAAAADDPRFAGARFGDVVHAAFETVDFAAWRGWREGPPPSGQSDALVDAFRGEGYSQAEIDDGLPLLAALVGHTLTVALPEGARLCDVPADARRAEMEFHFALDHVGVDALLATVQAHGLLTAREGFGARRTLDGLMTGKIDLIYTHGDRYFVLDYKTNRLPDYAPASLARAMHDGEYTLQAAIYTLALHRWLRFRLGAAYDYERDMGGLRYVFCRGVDARRASSPGVYADRLPFALIDALDRLFGGVA